MKVRVALFLGSKDTYLVVYKAMFTFMIIRISLADEIISPSQWLQYYGS